MVFIQLTLEKSEGEATVRCGKCGLEEPFGPGLVLPASGGSLTVRDGRVAARLCGPCWENRPRTWKCPRCAGTGAVWSNFCSTCHHERPDPLAYIPDWDLIAKEERERQREHDALVAECDREYPGWRTQHMGRHERL